MRAENESLRQQVADLEVRVVLSPHADEASYRRHRRYHPVPGFIGTFASLAEAHAGVLADIDTRAELARVTGKA